MFFALFQIAEEVVVEATEQEPADSKKAKRARKRQRQRLAEEAGREEVEVCILTFSYWNVKNISNILYHRLLAMSFIPSFIYFYVVFRK